MIVQDISTTKHGHNPTLYIIPYVTVTAQGDGASYLMFARGNSIMQMPFEPTPDNLGTVTLTIPGKALKLRSNDLCRFLFAFSNMLTSDPSQ